MFQCRMEASIREASPIAKFVIGIGTWSVTANHARAATTGVDPLGMMTGAQSLPTWQYVDYSVVFN
jgi:hypothetical protein